MNEIFLNEWRLYRQGLARPTFRGEHPQGSAAFDGNVRSGDIRIFADANRPFVALILEDRGLAGRRIVPVSPFSVPASSRERLYGPHVLQLWNACTAARRFTDRSWLVDTLPAAALAVIREEVRRAHVGRLTAGDDPLAQYERAFLVTGGTFVPFAAPPRVSQNRFAWLAIGSRLAASFLLCLGAFYLMIGTGRERLRVWRESALLVRAEAEAEVVELCAPSEEKQVADVMENEPFGIDFIQPQRPQPAAVCAEVPVARTKGPSLGQLRRMSQVTESVKPVRLDADMIDPYVMPLSVIECGAQGAVTSVPDERAGRSGSQSPSGYQERRPPSVDCRKAIGSEDGLVMVAIRLPSDPVRIEVFFDKELVRGYRDVTRPGSELLYEVQLRESAFVNDDFCRVTVRWQTPAGEVRRVLPLRPVPSASLRIQPTRPQSSAISVPDDVPVEVNFKAR